MHQCTFTTTTTTTTPPATATANHNDNIKNDNNDTEGRNWCWVVIFVCLFLVSGCWFCCFFFTISSLCLQHLRLSGQGTTVYKSRAIYRVVITSNLCATWYEETAQIFSLTDLKSHVFLALYHWFKPLLDKGGEEAGAPQENP